MLVHRWPEIPDLTYSLACHGFTRSKLHSSGCCMPWVHSQTCVVVLPIRDQDPFWSLLCDASGFLFAVQIRIRSGVCIADRFHGILVFSGSRSCGYRLDSMGVFTTWEMDDMCGGAFHQRSGSVLVFAA